MNNNKFVFHRKPHNMFGDVLFPLNSMKEILPEIYQDQVAKYKGREFLMEEKVPILNCKWNDVLHLAPINPQIIYKELLKCKIEFNPNIEWYKFPIDKITCEKTVMFKYESERADLNEDEIIQFRQANFTNLNKVPIRTLEYYQKCAETSKRPLLFHMVPHILTLDSINIKDCEIITWG